MEYVETIQWIELSDDLLYEIANLLYSYDDYCRFRAVCKEWNRVLPQIPNRPWLVLPFDDKAIETRIAEKKIYYMTLPELRITKLRGSCFGWLITVGVDGTLRMLNPFTRKHNDLPPISTFPDILDYNPDRENPYMVKDLKFFNGDGNDSSSEDDDHHDEDSDDSDHSDHVYEEGPTYGTFYIPNKYIFRTYIKKIIISSPPDNDNNQEDFMAIAIYGLYNRLAFCKHGYNKWIDIPKSQKDDFYYDYGYEDVVFHQGKIYVIDTLTQVFEFDIKNLATPLGGIIEIPKPHDLYFAVCRWKLAYLIGCMDGSLLMVVRHLNFYDDPNKNLVYNNSPKFDIYKLEKETKQWLRVSELRYYALLIGFNSSISMSAQRVPSGWKNGIHYTDNILCTLYYGIVDGNDIGVFNLEDGTSNQLLPDITLIFPPPIWLV